MTCTFQFTWSATRTLLGSATPNPDEFESEIVVEVVGADVDETGTDELKGDRDIIERKGEKGADGATCFQKII
jgi:hypothetical protein